MLIIISSDHNGIDLKLKIVKYLKSINHTVIDLGPFDNKEPVDYTDYAKQVGTIISHQEADRGILLCGTGVGMSIVVNRHENVRAVLAHNITTAQKSREHNNSNVLCLGSWINSEEEIKNILDIWLSENWQAGRHVRRVETIDSNKNGIVLTNGVFDIFHHGHLELLKFAKKQGEKLVVAIDSDNRVRSLKGPSRPINSQDDRKKLLESNIYVDEVIIFDSQEDLINLYATINPDTIVKGSEWTSEEVRINDKIPEHIQIKLFPLHKKYSTTNTIKNIKLLETWEKTKIS